jgi:hypothetical protein
LEQPQRLVKRPVRGAGCLSAGVGCVWILVPQPPVSIHEFSAGRVRNSRPAFGFASACETLPLPSERFQSIPQRSKRAFDAPSTNQGPEKRCIALGDGGPGSFMGRTHEHGLLPPYQAERDVCRVDLVHARRVCLRETEERGSPESDRRLALPGLVKITPFLCTPARFSRWTVATRRLTDPLAGTAAAVGPDSACGSCATQEAAATPQELTASADALDT